MAPAWCCRVGARKILFLAGRFDGEPRPKSLQAGLPAPEESHVGSVIKKRRKRMAKKKHRKLLKKTRIQRRRAGK